jgi:chorismate mutase
VKGTLYLCINLEIFNWGTLFATKIEYVFDVVQSYFKYPMKAEISTKVNVFWNFLFPVKFHVKNSIKKCIVILFIKTWTGTLPWLSIALFFVLFIVWYTNYPIMIIFSIWQLTRNVISNNSFHLFLFKLLTSLTLCVNVFWNFLFPVKFHVKNSIKKCIVILFIGSGKNWKVLVIFN